METCTGTYSSMIGASHSSSDAIAAYRALYAVCSDRASSKAARGKGEGKSETGAWDARALFTFSATKEAGGRTVRPWERDQSVKDASRKSDWPCVRAGGYEAIFAAGAGGGEVWERAVLEVQMVKMVMVVVVVVVVMMVDGGEMG